MNDERQKQINQWAVRTCTKLSQLGIKLSYGDWRNVEQILIEGANQIIEISKIVKELDENIKADNET